MNVLSRLIVKAVEKSLENDVPKILENKIYEQIQKSIGKADDNAALSQTGFIWAMAFRYDERGKDIGFKQAIDLAKIDFTSFLKDEKILFGDKSYGWTKDDATCLADEFLEHWEYD